MKEFKISNTVKILEGKKMFEGKIRRYKKEKEIFFYR